ncbi:hypothetical protein MK338_01480, partial [Streptococcus vestibularis]|nr:hypothetical protein [Streptococcus vestibularis]
SGAANEIKKLLDR